MRRHVFTAEYSYELPFGKGKKFFTGVGRLGQLAVGGWQVGGISYLRTGLPFSLTYTATQTGWRSGRPNAVVTDHYRRPIAAGIAGSMRRATPFRLRCIRNLARNALFGPGDVIFDVSALKNFAVTERVAAQFRAEFFNMPNHANFGNPATNISPPSTIVHHECWRSASDPVRSEVPLLRGF
jgi:hypothetical protein